MVSAVAAPSLRAAAAPVALPALPALVDGVVAHRRFTPFDRAFRHRAHQWLVDLDALPRATPLAAFRAADHLGDPGR